MNYFCIPGLLHSRDTSSISLLPYKMSVYLVEDAVSEFFGIDKEKLWLHNRKGDCAIARHYYCYTLRDRFQLSLPFIGITINRDHTTVINSTKKADNLMSVYTEYREYYESISKIMSNKVASYSFWTNPMDIGSTIKAGDLSEGIEALYLSKIRYDYLKIYSVVLGHEWINEDLIKLKLEPTKKNGWEKEVFVNPNTDLVVLRDYRQNRN